MKLQNPLWMAVVAAALLPWQCSLAQPTTGNTAPAYYLSEFEVTDAEGMKPYSAAVESTFTPFGGRYAVRGGQRVSLEGAPAQRIVMIAFPSLAQAQAWYDSAAYRALRPIRQGASTSRVFIVEGFVAESTSAQPAESAPAQQITRAGTQPSVTGPADYFSGRVRVDPVWPADGHINASGGLVTFEPGSRSAWHRHPEGQRLVIMSGVGLTQQWGQPIQELRPGDVVWCPPGVKHWHGAAPANAMTHLAVSGTSTDGKNVEWMEPVTDEQYRAR